MNAGTPDSPRNMLSSAVEAQQKALKSVQTNVDVAIDFIEKGHPEAAKTILDAIKMTLSLVDEFTDLVKYADSVTK